MKKQQNLTEVAKKNIDKSSEKTQNSTKDNAIFQKRVREITAKSFSLSGIINNNQLKNPIQFESSLERDFIYLLEFNIEVKHYLEQPLIIQYIDKEGKKRNYIPDFIIEYFDNKPSEIIEIKYESTLELKKEELFYKFKAAEEFCNKHGLMFKIVSDSYIRNEKEIELTNYKFLDRYKNYFYNINKEKSAFPILNENLVILRNKLEKMGTCSVKELIEHCTEDKNMQAELIFLTWYMVSNSFVKADYSEKLTLNSKICLA